jgi:uncharacterized protein YlxP (DUF503 family)
MLTRSSTAVLPKATATQEHVLQALTKALRSHPECERIDLARLQFVNNQGPANWDVEFEAKDGAEISSECRRVLLSVKHSVQKRFNLISEIDSTGNDE